MDKSFKEWLTTYASEKYIWEINEVTKDQGYIYFEETN